MKRHNRLKKHTLGLAAALLMTAGMSQIALAGDSVYVNTKVPADPPASSFRSPHMPGFSPDC